MWNLLIDQAGYWRTSRERGGSGRQATEPPSGRNSRRNGSGLGALPADGSYGQSLRVAVNVILPFAES